jgi:hypothetical protein
MQSPKPAVQTKDLLSSTAWFLLASAVFALAYTQAPLYYSNQNQYFVQGLADAGLRHLEEDWLANTQDPTPLFTGLVAFTYRALPEFTFHIYYALLMGVYCVSLAGIFTVLAGPRATPLLRLSFLALLVLLHSGLLRLASDRLLGIDYPWYLQAGLAGQYMLGDMFQPSVFGVFFLAAVYFFLREQPLAAAACAALTALVHATYLLPAAVLTAAFLAVLLGERRWRQALLAAALALLVVMPALVYSIVYFWPAAPEVFAQAQDILIHVRIPHHTIPAIWADTIAYLQIAWMLLGTVLARGSRLFPVMGICLLIGAALTVVQIITDHPTLAMLFPWRLSIFLVPLATTVILTRLLRFGSQRLTALGPRSRRLLESLNLVILVVAVAGGIFIMAKGYGYQTGDEELEMMAWVRDHSEAGDVYLLPARIPKLEITSRGSRSTSFKSLASKRGDDRVIPVDLQRFRLRTGAAIYVDFKAIPYQGGEVVEWYERLQTNADLTRAMHEKPCAAWLPQLRAIGVTHVVVPAAKPLACPELPRPVYEDSFYLVYPVKPP